jgi:hypothetical protein
MSALVKADRYREHEACSHDRDVSSVLKIYDSYLTRIVQVAVLVQVRRVAKRGRARNIDT